MGHYQQWLQSCHEDAEFSSQAIKSDINQAKIINARSHPDNNAFKLKANNMLEK
jgi:hypothetical protein